MQPIREPRIKICCIASIREAELAIRYGAAAIGLVSAMPSGPGPIPEELIRRIALSVPSTVETFLLTSLTNPQTIISQHHRCSTGTIQLCDRQEISTYNILREGLPGVRIVQVIHVAGPSSVTEAQKVSEQVDALLLDSGNPDLPVKELGGTGRVHNWSISASIRESVNVPIYLAGGLNGTNVTAAIEAVAPFGIDVCSGVRTNGVLDEAKLSKFFIAVTGGTIG